MNVTGPIVQALVQVNYTYDQVNQLTGATKNVSTNTDETFTYDNLGNRLKKNNQAVNNVYDNNNRIVEDDKYTYSHDDSGNLVKKVNKQSGYTHKYIWDFENKLQYVTEHLTENSGTLKTHTYIYDALGRRIMKDSKNTMQMEELEILFKQQWISKFFAIIPVLIFLGMCLYGLIAYFYPECFYDITSKLIR